MRPAFDLFFALNRRPNIRSGLKVHQLMHMVFFCKAVCKLMLMLVDTAL